MADGTYERNGMSFGHFNKDDQDEYEHIGRQGAWDYWEKSRNYKVEDFDRDKLTGQMIYENPDLHVCKGEYEYFIEAATKADDIFSLAIKFGPHAECRKLKMMHIGADRFLLQMFNMAGTQFLFLPGVGIQRAWEYCGETKWLGFNSKRTREAGLEEIQSSPGFVKPKHGCFRVKKWCQRKNGKWYKEDFVEIPYKLCAHYRVIVPGKEYLQVKAFGQ